MPLDVLETLPGLISVVSGFTGILGLLLTLSGHPSPRLFVGYSLGLLGFLTIAGAVASSVSQHVPVLSAGSAVLGGIATCGLLIGGTGVVIVIRTRGPHQGLWDAIASVMQGIAYPPDRTGRIDKPVQLDVISRRRSTLQRLGRRPPGKLVILTGPAGSGKTVGLRSIVVDVSQRATRRPRRLAFYVEVHVEDLPHDRRVSEGTIKEHLKASVRDLADQLAPYLEQTSARPPWLFVFDLREELSPAQVQQYVQAVQNFIVSRNDCAIVATRTSVPDKPSFAMAPLTLQQQWHLLNATGHPHSGVLQRLRQDPRISDIATNPLLLCLLGNSLTSDELGSTRHQVLDNIIVTLLREDSVIADASELAFLTIDEPREVNPDIRIAEALTHAGLGRMSAIGFRFAHTVIHHHLAGRYLCGIAVEFEVEPLLDDPRWHPVVVAALRADAGVLQEKVMEVIRARLAKDIDSLEHLVKNTESLTGNSDLPIPGSFNWRPASLALLTLLCDGFIDGTGPRANTLMAEVDILVLTAIAAGANRDRADAIDLLPLTSREVAAAVTDYIIGLEDETGLTDRLVIQLAASPKAYQRMSGPGQLWLLREAAKPHRIHHVLFGATRSISADSLPGRMRWILRIGQLMALGIIALTTRSAIQNLHPDTLVFDSVIATVAASFLMLSVIPHPEAVTRIFRVCGIAVAGMVGLFAAIGSLAAAISFIHEIITAQIKDATGSAILLWLTTWPPAMLAHAATAPPNTTARLLLLPQLRVMRNPAMHPLSEQIKRAVRRARSTPIRLMFSAIAVITLAYLAIAPQYWSNSTTGDPVATALPPAIAIATLIAVRPIKSRSSQTRPRQDLAANPLDVFRVDNGDDTFDAGLRRISESIDSLNASEALLANLDSILEFIKETLPKQMDEPIKPRVWTLMPKEKVPGLHSLLRDYDRRNPGNLTMRAHSSRERQKINLLRGQARSKGR
ncbi:hypothetical protein ACIRSS_42200 [Amycolatopsis sp. NPDC101161]|uniref:hypothetical protein n=1 Tax=Amycolatopsis sp. NPDC101161 TaxID=3363940 RepID=UPI0038159F92